jgi:hypothetical protein
VLNEGFEIGKILKESEDFFGGFELVFDIVFVKCRHIIIETVDIRTLLAHRWLDLLGLKDVRK